MDRRSCLGSPEQEDHEHDEREANHSEISLNAAALQQRENLAAARDGLTALVKTGVHYVCIKEVVEPRKTENEIGDDLHGAIPDPSIKPIADARPPGVQPENRCAVHFVYIKGMAQDGEN